MKNIKPILFLATLFLSSFFSDVYGEEKRPPNIIFILTDDLGYGDLGVLFQNQRKIEGKPYHSTPNLDQFASEGMRLNRHYVPAPVCAPSRSSLLRGLHQGHAEIRNNQFDKALPDNHNLASVLKEAGYVTALIGKYGLQGLNGDSPDTWSAYPTKRGFDYFFGYVRHVDGHNHYPAHEAPERSPVELWEDNQEISSDLEGCYTTDLFTARAKKYIVDHQEKNSEKPFFLYLAHDTPHAGLQVASKPYPEGKGLQGGLQWIGEAGNYINTADGEIDTYIHPEYAVKDWPEVHQRFASMVRRIDDSVGDLVQLLKDLEIDDETLIVFTSDNGPHHESYGYGKYEPTLFESFGLMNGTKRDTWEGGIRVPTLVRWPGKIPEDSRLDTPTAFHDWLATFADLSGLPAPANTDGVSMMPLLKGEKTPFGGKVYIEYTVGGATPDYPSFLDSRKGRTRGEMQVLYLHGYKGIRYDIQSHTDDFHIFDTQNDPREANDLAGTSEEFEELQAEMKRRVIQWRRPNAEAKRLYDNEPLPKIDYEVPLKEGVMYRQYRHSLPFVPDVNTLKFEPNIVKAISSIEFHPQEQGGFVNVYEGYFEVPETGTYTFRLNSAAGTVMHIHEALLFDADKGYTPGQDLEAEIILEKGFHPFRIIYGQYTGTTPQLSLLWEGGSKTSTSFLTGKLYYPDFSK